MRFVHQDPGFLSPLKAATRLGVSVCVSLGFLALGASAAAQKPASARAKAPGAKAATAPKAAAAKAAPAVKIDPALKRRIDAYYNAIQENKKGDAFQIVAPDSRNEFFDMDYHTLVGYRVTGVQYADQGSTATVSLMRSERVPPFEQVLDLSGKDTWKKVDGQWCLVLETQREVMTPFGPIHPHPNAGNAAPKDQEVQQQLQKKVDPAAALKALQTAEKQSGAPVTDFGKQDPPKKPASTKKPADSSKEKANPPIPHK